MGRNTYGSMEQASIRVVEVNNENVDDVLRVCTFPSVKNEPCYRKGCEIRRKWLTDLLRTTGPCAKIAYLADKPVGAIEYTPLHLIPYFKTKRKDVLYIHCIYVPRRRRHRGIGSALLDSLINEMSKPNKLFHEARCRMLATSARKVYGYTQLGLFKQKGFMRTKGNTDAALVLPLSDTAKLEMDVPSSKPKTVTERGVIIFFKPTCQYCTCTNERIIKAEIRKVNKQIPIEEVNLWTHPEEAIKRRITCVATYINGKPVLPMAPAKFLKTLRTLASKI
jgi:GNAT superfamily N-acetyltransferase